MPPPSYHASEQGTQPSRPSTEAAEQANKRCPRSREWNVQTLLPRIVSPCLLPIFWCLLLGAGLKATSSYRQFVIVKYVGEEETRGYGWSTSLSTG